MKIIILALALLITSFKPLAINDKNYNVKLQIINSQTKEINNFIVNISKNPQEQIRGLMDINHLPENYGMLFEFKKEEIAYMWMKNTKIELDMLFINKDGKILHIKQRAKTESEEVISSKFKVNKVLEINGGLCKKLNINIGDSVRMVSTDHSPKKIFLLKTGSGIKYKK